MSCLSISSGPPVQLTLMSFWPFLSYWPSTIMYQPVPPSIDPVPSYINQYHSILTQCHDVSNVIRWLRRSLCLNKMRKSIKNEIWGKLTSAHLLTLGLVVFLFNSSSLEVVANLAMPSVSQNESLNGCICKEVGGCTQASRRLSDLI